MPFVHRNQVPLDVRRHHESAFKGQLRQALGNPGLTAEQRQRVKDQLAEVGKQDKTYRAETPPKPGAISFLDPLPTRDVLVELTRVELLAVAKRLDVPTNGTKVQIIDRLMTALESRGK